MNTLKAIALLSLAVLGAALGGCASAKVTAQRHMADTPTTRPTAVYVADFELEASNVRAERGLLPPLPPPPPGLGEVLPRLPGSPREPAARARALVELMSKSLVKALSDANVSVRRLGRSEQPPSSGWLVRGVFTSVQEGNQLRRAVIGFGAGATKQVIATIDDLTQGAPTPMYEVTTKADSGKLPGAAITLNPYVAAARFVLSDRDLDRNVTQTAAQIAEHTVQRVRAAETATRGTPSS
jgi:hypothetical protein